MRKRNIKLIVERCILFLLALAPIFVYGCTLYNERVKPFGENKTDYQLVALSVGDSFNADTLLYIPLFSESSGTYYDLELTSNEHVIQLRAWWASSPYLSIRDNTSDIRYLYRGIDFTNGFYTFSFSGVSIDFSGADFIVTAITHFPLNQFDIKFSLPITTFSDSYSFESFMVDYMHVFHLPISSESNIVYSAFDSLFGMNSLFGLSILDAGALLYLSYVVILEIIALVVDFLLFIPRLCRKWLNAFINKE